MIVTGDELQPMFAEEFARLRAEIARLQSPPGASAMERGQALMQELFDLGYRTARSDCKGDGAAIRAIEQAEAEARAKAIEEAREILHEEGWVGRSEQRIAALAKPSGERK